MTNISDIAKQLGSRGGKKSAESRLGGKTPKERSDAMRKLRSSKMNAKIDVVTEALLDSMKRVPREEQY